jgi:opacity protein-like surface antigen
MATRARFAANIGGGTTPQGAPVMKIFFLACLLAAGSIATASAQSRDTRGPGWEFGFDVIYQDSTDISFEGGSTASLHEDWGLVLSVAYRINERLEVGFGLDWQTTEYNADLQSATLPDLRIGVNGDLEAFTPRGWLNFNFVQGPITPYVTGGIGWAFVDTNIPNSRVEIGCWWDPWWGQICTPYQSTKSIDGFVYNLGAGVRWDIGSAYTLRLGYEKHWFDYGNANGTPDLDQWKLGIAFRY